MEAQKAALVEASRCRILKAARIKCKEAEELLLKSNKAAVEAFEAAAAIGVIMFDKPNCPQVHYQIETSLANGGGSTTHTFTASFETAFEVDNEVTAAVKNTFVRLENCSPFSNDELKDLRHKINENPETGDSNHELQEFSSGCEMSAKTKSKRRQFFENLSRANLVEMLLERLKCLQEDELSSLATIIATCGLNAALCIIQSRRLIFHALQFLLAGECLPREQEQ